MQELADSTLPSIELTPTREGLRHGHFQSNAWVSDRASFIEATIDSLVTCSRAARHTRDIGHLIFVTRYFGGSAKGFADDQVVDRHPGSIYIMDGDLRWNGIQECGTVQTINLPKSILGYDPDKHPEFLEVSTASVLGQCLNLVLDTAYEELSPEGADLPSSVLYELIACVKMALGQTDQRQDIRAHARDALHRLICDFVERNLHRGDLSTDLILKSFGVSRASLYRMFEPQGGVRKFITERRAMHAVIDLSNGTGRRGYVREVSERWGFPTAAEFNRTIRRLYEQNPSTLFAPAGPRVHTEPFRSITRMREGTTG